MKHLLRLFVLGCCLGAGVAESAWGKNPNQFAYGDITKPDFFPILPWDPYHGWTKPGVESRPNGLESIAECRFNMAGFVLPRDLRQCEKLGLGALLLPVANEFTNFQYLCQWKNLSDEEIDRRVKETIRAAGSSRAVMGYFIMDEPGVKDFPALAKAVAAVKRYAPGKLAYINLFPDYATLGAPDRSQLGTTNYTEYLERFVTEVKPQAISYDNYMVPCSDDLSNAGPAASYYRNLLEVRRVAQKYRLPCLNIVCCNRIRPHTPVPSPANLSFQAYTTLAAGYRGVSWYNYYGPGYQYTPINASGGKSLSWVYLQQVNAQVAALAPVMSRLSSTGVFFSAPAPVADLPLLPGGVVEAVTCSTPVMVGEFKHENGDAYAMVVNLSLQKSARFTVQTRGGAIQIVSPVDGTLSAYDQKEGLWLTAGQGTLLRLGR
jgi:hypothetical protein